MSLNKFDITGTKFTATGAAMTDSSGGTASATLAAVTATYNETVIENTVASLAAEIEANRVDIAALMAALNTANGA